MKNAFLHILTVLVFTLSVYGRTDTAIVFITNEHTTSYVDTLYMTSGIWQTIEFDISDYPRDSIRSIMFGALHHTLDTGDFYMKEIALYGTDTLVVEDFSSYDPSIIIGPGRKLQASDRYWSATWVYDGSAFFATVLQGTDTCLHCYYIGRLGKVGSTLHLTFSPDKKDWSQYHTIRFTVKNVMATAIADEKKHHDIPDISVYIVKDKGLCITLPKQYESLDLCIYTVSGKLLTKRSFDKNEALLWRTGALPCGAYIITVSVGSMTFSKTVSVIDRY